MSAMTCRYGLHCVRPGEWRAGSGAIRVTRIRRRKWEVQVDAFDGWGTNGTVRGTLRGCAVFAGLWQGGPDDRERRRP